MTRFLKKGSPVDQNIERQDTEGRAAILSVEEKLGVGRSSFSLDTQFRFSYIQPTETKFFYLDLV